MRIAAYVLLSALSLPAAAQTQTASDRCAGVLTAAARNELLTISQADREAYHYRRVCRLSGLDTAAEFEKAKAILGFEYDSRDAYCSSEAARDKDDSFDYLRVSTAVESALQPWVECHRLNRAGIVATPIVEPERFTLTLQRASTAPGRVNWVRTTAGTKCFAKVAGGKLAELRAEIDVALSAAEPWTLVCDRVAVNGGRIYPATIITVDTTAGAFQMKLPAVGVGSGLDSQMSERLKRVETSLDATNARLDRVADSIPNAIAVTVGPQRGFREATKFAGAQQDTTAATNFAECDGTSVLSAFKLWQSVSAVGYYYKCGTLSLVRR